nr:hypothetical protein [Tanacetum cinerariifolium]
MDEPPKVELKDLPPHLEYAFLEGDDKFPVIIAKDLSVEEKTALITEDFKPAVQYQRRVNPKIHDVIKNEVLKLLDAGLIYPISDSPWILMGNEYYCFLDGFYGYFQIPIDPKDQEKPHSFVHTERLPVVACLLSYAMQRARFREKMLKWCEDTNLCLNWEKTHFMVKEGIVLDHKISKNGIKVDKAKVAVIAKLPHPTTVKGICSFLGHAGFYRRFIQDFSKIARPMTRLLKKDIPFFFSKECVKAIQTLKRKLTKALILIAPDWDFPFELMCDASDFPIGAVLGQRQENHFRPIHYASKTMTEAESNYTTTKKEMLAVVKVQLNELNELHDQAYENSLIYKEKTKRLHDSKIKDCVFNIGDRVLLFNSRLKIFSGKLKSRWSGPFTISHVFLYGTVELSQPDGPNFQVNGHRLKHYFEEDVPKMVFPDLQTFLKDQ